MKIIYKYTLGTPFHNLVKDLSIPKGAKILNAQMQGNELCIWFVLNNKNSLKERTFHIYGTGFELENYDKKHYEYISTVQTAHGLVWHLFEVYE